MEPLDFSMKICRRISLSGVKYWRCGLVSVGLKNIFVGVDDVIRVYEKSQSDGLVENLFRELKCQVEPHSVIRGEIDVMTPLSFNSIKVGYIGNEEVLVCCTDSGFVNVWFTEDLLRSPLILNTGRSAWGIAIHPSKMLLAISSNSHDISLWSLGVVNPFEEWNTNNTGWPHKFYGHNDNIPSICFNRSGTILSSAGIDATCRLWDVISGSLLHVYMDSHRGWFVGFVDSIAFKVLKRVDLSEKQLKSSSNQVNISSMDKNYINEDNLLHMIENCSDLDDEKETALHESDTDDSLEVQNSFYTNLSVRELFKQSNLISSDSLDFFSFEKHDDFFSCYTSINYNELLFYGTEKSIKICCVRETLPGIQLSAECKNIFDNNENIESILRYMDRINMVEFIPDLSLCIVASQKGKACLMHMARSVVKCKDGTILSSYTIIADQQFPEDPPLCGLLGMTVEKVFLRLYKLYVRLFN
ncbi:hypothetical protein PNEG_01162 [Pneumocystis murina B123]|uniref:Uncharacterized protein n=1 Tax=Pneumocystis murina (strain B123) TaxID=1069680 RepID=M7NP14_PNEMU|nr:hypothetical protein PNEG_01162 [Pneumocystis murina B123]EMR10448.1 hypothetical protein PNEG_01162 [Pneumocystis murina B123]